MLEKGDRWTIMLGSFQTAKDLLRSRTTLFASFSGKTRKLARREKRGTFCNEC
jgi:hypothetical protein